MKNEIVLYKDNEIRVKAYKIKDSSTIKIIGETKMNDSWEIMNETFLNLKFISQIHEAWGKK